MLTTSTAALFVTLAFLMSEPVHCATRRRIASSSPGARTATVLSDMGNPPGTKFVPVRWKRMRNGRMVSRYQQQWHGVPVEGGLLTVTTRVTSTERMSGYVVEGVEGEAVDPKQKITEAAALQAAGFNDLPPEKKQPDSETVTLKVVLTADSTAVLVYEVSWVQGPPLMRLAKLLRADTGEVLKTWDATARLRDGEGPGGNLRSGKHHLRLPYMENQEPHCHLETPLAMTIDAVTAGAVGILPGQAAALAAHNYTCGEPQTERFTNGAYAPMNDAHNSAHEVFSLFSRWGDEPKLFPHKMRLFVHYEEKPGTIYGNAAFMGGARSIDFVFGDGGSAEHPLTGIDIVAHELAHAATHYTSQLQAKGVDGAVGESFADVVAATADYKTGVAWERIFSVGDEAEKDSPTRIDGTLAHPKAWKEGGVLTHAARYNPATHDEEVHKTSGILNKVFYALAHHELWGVKKGFMVFLRANLDYWFSSLTFDDAACGVLDAALDLSFDSPAELAALWDAFAIVGLTPCGEDRPQVPAQPAPCPPKEHLVVSQTAGAPYTHNPPANPDRFLWGNGYHTFQMVYTLDETPLSPKIILEWRQTSWLDSPVIEGYQPISVPDQLTAERDAAFRGLGASDRQDSALYDGNGGSRGMWNVVGLIKHGRFPDGIPGFLKGHAYRVDLYVLEERVSC